MEYNGRWLVLGRGVKKGAAMRGEGGCFGTTM